MGFQILFHMFAGSCSYPFSSPILGHLMAPGISLLPLLSPCPYVVVESSLLALPPTGTARVSLFSVLLLWAAIHSSSTLLCF